MIPNAFQQITVIVEHIVHHSMYYFKCTKKQATKACHFQKPRMSNFILNLITTTTAECICISINREQTQLQEVNGDLKMNTSIKNTELSKKSDWVNIASIRFLLLKTNSQTPIQQSRIDSLDKISIAQRNVDKRAHWVDDICDCGQKKRSSRHQ